MDSSKAEKPLDSDELGEKGEKRFAELCNDAKLICNPSIRDRTGWDFYVEFRQEPPRPPLTLDSRPAPISLGVQLKTQWSDGNGRIKLRLSSVEQLAKDLKPTFIYVLLVEPDLSIDDAYVIEIKDDVLATILKRLRLEQAKGRSKVNDVEITFDFKALGARLPAIGRCFRDWVEERCGDVELYAMEKARQLKELGFGAGKYELKCTFVSDNIDDLIDGLMGFKPLKTIEFEANENRFGIKLPLNGSTTLARGELTKRHMEVTIVPKPFMCTLTIRGRASRVPAKFRGGMHMPPIRLPKQHQKLLVQTDFFEIEVRDELLRIRSARSYSDSYECGIEDWISFLRALIIFAEGNCKIEIKPDDSRLQPLVVPFASKWGEEQLAEHQSALRVLEESKVILGYAGGEGAPAKFLDMVADNKGISELHHVLQEEGRSFAMSFLTDTAGNIDLPQEVEMLYVNFLNVSGVQVAYSASAILQPQNREDGVAWKGSTAGVRRVAAVHDFPIGYETFIETEKRESHLRSFIIRQPDQGNTTMVLEE